MGGFRMATDEYAYYAFNDESHQLERDHIPDHTPWQIVMMRRDALTDCYEISGVWIAAPDYGIDEHVPYLCSNIDHIYRNRK